MSKLAVQQRPRSIFPELSEFFEGLRPGRTCARLSAATSFVSRTS